MRSLQECAVGVFLFIRRIFVESWFFMAFFKIFAAFAAAVSRTVQFSGGRDFSRKSALTELFRCYRLLAVDGEISAKRLFCFMAALLAPAEQPAGMPSPINCSLWDGGRSVTQSQSLYHLPKKAA